jgi:hypothetical protein
VSQSYNNEGFELFEAVFNTQQIAALVLIADALSAAEKKPCIRNLTEKSLALLQLAESQALRQFIPTDYSLVRSILFNKTAESNWSVPWHQDLTVALRSKIELAGYGPWSVKEGVHHVQPPTSILEQLVTLRVHLDPTIETNGALHMIRKSHRSGKLDSHSLRNFVKNGQHVICVCQPGDVLKMSPLLLHASGKSSKPATRRVLHFEYASSSALNPKLQWFS